MKSKSGEKSVSIIGAGRLGGALARALARAGYAIENLIVKNRETGERTARAIEPSPQVLLPGEASAVRSRIVFIATQDFAIDQAVRELERLVAGPETFVFHTSGSLSSAVLEPLKKKGCRTGSFHPLVSVSDAERGAQTLGNAFFCLEGESEAVARAQKIVADLGGNSFSVDAARKALYHAAAVTACGHLVALVDVAREMLAACGLSADQARATLLPLIASTVDNLAAQPPAEALTGTFARADVAAFERHVRAIEEGASAEALEIYLALGARSAQLAATRGGRSAQLAEILRQISIAKTKLQC